MDAKELTQLYYIEHEIKSIKLELAKLKAERNEYRPNVISDMPRGHGKSAEDAQIEYLDTVMALEDSLNYSLKKLQYERKKIIDFVETIEDPQLRLIVRLRCVNNMSWYAIADEAGIDRRTASKKFYEFLKMY